MSLFAIEIVRHIAAGEDEESIGAYLPGLVSWLGVAWFDRLPKVKNDVGTPIGLSH